MDFRSRVLIAAGVALAVAAAACATRDQLGVAAPPGSPEWVKEQEAKAAAIVANPPRYDVPLLYIDGRRAVGNEVPENVDRVQLLDRAAAEARIGGPAPHGVLWITTRAAPKQH